MRVAVDAVSGRKVRAGFSDKDCSVKMMDIITRIIISLKTPD
jgi:hypothetical protein